MRLKKIIKSVGTMTQKAIDQSSSKSVQSPIFVDSLHKVSFGPEAASRIDKQNDMLFYRSGKGVLEVDQKRWEEAQKYEKQAWMAEGGLRRKDDRNNDHKKGFDGYRTLKGMQFESCIELGCGPFTNVRHILKKANCKKVLLLDPLINDYLTHPYCAYKNRRLGKWFGKKVQLVNSPIENYRSQERFDLIVLINVIEHCFSIDQVFQKILSIMQPAGILVFNDKLIPKEKVETLLKNVYDTGHPLRVTEDIILNFLENNFKQLFRQDMPVKTIYGAEKTIYYIGRKKQL